jgi:D-threo-aldose 1-dehydrogenase
MPEATHLRRLGRIDLELTPAGLGGAPLGNLGSVMPDEQAADLVASAWEDGVRYFDTAPAYGNGLSELRFGQALEGRPRDAFVLSTKVGCTLTPGEPEPGPWVDPAPYRMTFDYSYDGALRQLESSLERLRTDRVEIVYIHDVDVAHHDAAQPQRFAEAMSGSYRALVELREQGVVRAIGVGVNEADVCTAAAEAGDFDCFLLAGRYTLLEQGAIADLLPLCEERDIAVVMGGVFNSGILATGAREGPGTTTRRRARRSSPASRGSRGSARASASRWGPPRRSSRSGIPPSPAWCSARAAASSRPSTTRS